ncbi:MAG TPA: helix-turn-helix transcriptional regulator [Candidatus Limnocylindria bacterium]|nr:helix-turn-helix transcriptional regulator [Candidatus Limnocylindria bacterium]
MRLSEEARLILASLAAGPKHGYAIAQDIESFAGRRLGPGTLYGAVARLESAGHIEAMAGEARRRPYRITGRGRAVLQEGVDESRRFVATARRRLAAR